MLRLLSPALFVATALAIAAVASASGTHDLVAGAGTITAVSDVSLEVSHFSVSGHSGPLGEDPTGQVTIMLREGSSPFTETDETNFHGDVKNGCVRAEGNRAVVVGELPEDQRFTVPTAPPELGQIRFAAVVAEDNDGVAGRPPDRALPVLLFERTGQRTCDGTRPLSAFPLFLLDHGNVVVTDATP
jgi:hypothetical protein